MSTKSILKSRFEEIKSRLEGIKTSYSQDTFRAKCPVHEDQVESIQVTLREDKIGIHCKEKCDFRDILHHIGLDSTFLYPQVIEKIYPYVDANHEVCFETVKFKPKSFAHRISESNWVMKDVEMIPYNLPGIIKAIEADEHVFFVNGEKDAESGIELGLAFTTISKGIDHWQSNYRKYFSGADIIFLQDQQISYDQIANIAFKLVGVAKRVQFIKLPELKQDEDFTDWLNQGGSKEKLMRLVEDKIKNFPQVNQSESSASPSNLVIDVNQLIDSPPLKKKWLVEDFLPEGILGMLEACKGSGKTGWLISLAIAVASGSDFLEKTVKTSRKVLMVLDQRSSDELHGRLFDRKSHRLKPAQIELLRKNLKIIVLRRRGLSSGGDEAHNHLIDNLAFNNYGLIVFDPKHQVFSGDETRYKNIVDFLSHLERLTFQQSTSVLFSHNLYQSIAGNIHPPTYSTFFYEDRLAWVCRLRRLSSDKKVTREISAQETGLLNRHEYLSWYYQELFYKDCHLLNNLNNCYLRREKGGVFIKKDPPIIPE